MQGPAFADQSRQALRAAAAGKESELHLGLAELGVFRRDANGAGHRRLAAAAERETIDGGDHRLAEIFHELEHALPETARFLGFDRRHMRQFADIRACDEGFVASAGENDAAYGGIVPGILERHTQILPGRRIQRVHHPGAIERHISDTALFLTQNILERQAVGLRGHGTLGWRRCR